MKLTTTKTNITLYKFTLAETNESFFSTSLKWLSKQFKFNEQYASCRLKAKKLKVLTNSGILELVQFSNADLSLTSHKTVAYDQDVSKRELTQAFYEIEEDDVGPCGGKHLQTLHHLDPRQQFCDDFNKASYLDFCKEDCIPVKNKMHIAAHMRFNDFPRTVVERKAETNEILCYYSLNECKKHFAVVDGKPLAFSARDYFNGLNNWQNTKKLEDRIGDSYSYIEWNAPDSNFKKEVAKDLLDNGIITQKNYNKFISLKEVSNDRENV